MCASPGLHDADNDAIDFYGFLLPCLMSLWLKFFYSYHSHLIVFQLPVRHYETVRRSFRSKQPDLASQVEAVNSSARSSALTENKEGKTY